MYLVGEGEKDIEIAVYEVSLGAHVLSFGLSIIIENNLVACNTQLLKDCLLLCFGSAHDCTTLATLVAL